MFEPEGFLRLAARLLRPEADAETLRTVISRAYYAAFLIVRARHGKHDAYHAQLWSEVEQAQPMLGGIGNRLRRLRNAADYGDSIEDLPAEAHRALADAHLLISSVR